jgi:hypothetical protein
MIKGGPRDKQRGLGALCAVGLGLHAVWLLAFGCLIFIAKSPTTDSGNWIARAIFRSDSSANNNLDIIQAASELGRLDIAAFSLTFLGVVIAVGALMGFPLIRHSAIAEAVLEAGEVVRTDLKKHIDYSALIEDLLKDPRFLPTLIAKIETLKSSDDEVPPDEADKIAAAVGE